MGKLLWNEKFNIGVEVVDKAHARLFRMVGKLMDLAEYEPESQSACKESIKFLEDYTMTHFSEEEAYMRSVRYKGYEKHKKIHDEFRDTTLVSLKKYLKSSNYSPMAVQRFLNVMIGWLTGHIMVEDQAILGNVVAKSVYEETTDIPVVADAVNQAMKDVFRLNADLVSAEYNGRSIRNGYYYRLCYDMEDGGKVQLLLGLEEQLARRGVGMMLGLAAMQKPEMVREASVQILEQFFHHFGKLFKSSAEYHLSKEELLTKDEFREDFMTRYPTSLLFETRLGHFIFCARKWEVKKRKGD
ncbi:MAG: hemerythrin family protein [Lachnospiraceae bacterium]|nr:hemerythrin family protein [Lachnospiraceae bacterium]MCI9284175.1 hemerythrin family protein [Lachnospiraceae bacterium]